MADMPWVVMVFFLWCGCHSLVHISFPTHTHVQKYMYCIKMKSSLAAVYIAWTASIDGTPTFHARQNHTSYVLVNDGLKSPIHHHPNQGLQPSS